MGYISRMGEPTLKGVQIFNPPQRLFFGIQLGDKNFDREVEVAQPQSPPYPGKYNTVSERDGVIYE